MDHSSELTLFGQDKDQFKRKLKLAQESTGTLSKVETEGENHSKKKGSIAGVFIPTCENMWGVLIFLKFYYLIGMASFSQTLLAVLLSAVAAYATTVCLASIASSGGMLSEGGPYYMISRALGPAIGAAVGLVYWAGITLLAVLESVGAKESLELIFPPEQYHIMENVFVQKTIGAGIIAICSLSVFGGSNVVSKMGVVFAVIVVATIIMFYVGLFQHLAASDKVASMFAANWNFSATDNPTYESVGRQKASLGKTLAIFFPCFTGMLSGADRADVLANPARSIRYGTFAALTLSLVMYLSFLFIWSGVAERCVLLGVKDEGTGLNWAMQMCRKSNPMDFAKHFFAHEAGPRKDYFDAQKLGSVFGSDYATKSGDYDEYFHKAHYPQDVVGTLFGEKTRYVVYVGILLSCIAQVLQCLMVAPRLLQAIASDSIIPVFKYLAPLSKKGEPSRALLATLVIALMMVCALNGLEQAATFVSICFLVCYAFLCITCSLLTILRTTTWRPEGIFHKRWRMWYIVWGLVGFGVSIFIMVDVGAQYSLLVFLVSVALYLYIEFRGSAVEWGSGLDGFKFNFALKILQGLSHKAERKINWRPQILVLLDPAVQPLQAATPQSASATDVEAAEAPTGATVQPGAGSLGLVKLVGQLRKGKGMCIAASIFEASEVASEPLRRKMESERKQLEKAMEKEQIFGFTEVFQCASFGQGAQQAVQLCGLGGMRPNTVLLEWPEGSRWKKEPRRATEFVRLVDFALKAEKAVLCPKNADLLTSLAPQQNSTIDLWWFIHDGGLLILLAWLLSQHKAWRGCKVRIFIVMEEVGELAAHKAAKDFEVILKRKNILIDSVTPILLGDRKEMIAPYTYDWTLRAEKNTGAHGDLPVMLDDLFKTEAEIEAEALNNNAPATPQTDAQPADTDDLWARLTGERTVPAKPEAANTATAGETEVNEEELLSSVHSRLKEKRESMRRQAGHAANPSSSSATNVDIAHRPSNASLATPETFEHLNKLLLSRSAESSLVLINLPNIWGLSDQDCLSYVAYCDCLTQGLERVIFAHGAGTEIFSLF